MGRHSSPSPSPRRLTRRTAAALQIRPEAPPRDSTPSDVAALCDALFASLAQQLPHVLSGAAFAPAAPPAASFLQLLRSCLVCLEFALQIPQIHTVSLHKCGLLIDLLRKLCPPLVHSYVRRTGGDAGAPASFLCNVLEVFIHELTTRRQIRKHLAEIDYESATSGKLFVPHWSYGHMNTVLEFVSSHFLLSIHDEMAFSEFMSSLSWSVKAEYGIPEVGLSAALTLLGDPFMSSAPYMLQAHLILLTSRCIGIRMPTCDGNLNTVVMNHLLAAFELSVKHYGVYMRASDVLDKFARGQNQSRFHTDIPFDLCIRQDTSDELNHQIGKLAHFCHIHSHGVLPEMKSAIMNESGNYIIENQPVVDEMIQDETCLILNYIILKVLSWEAEKITVQENGEYTHQEIFCLAAVIKLMSSSLLQILWLFKREGFAVGMKTSKDKQLYDAYNFLLGIISCFAKYGVTQAIQEALLPMMEPEHRFKDLMLILAHFASLLSFSIKKRLEYLWRACIFMITVIINLIHFEDGNLDAFRPLLSNVEDPSVSHDCIVVYTPPVLDPRSSTVKIASSFQKIRKLYSLEQDKFLTYENQRGDVEMVDQDRPVSNGAAFLDALFGKKKRPPDFDDLADFLVCTPGKDYSEYLKNRSRFMEWGHKKRAEIKKKRLKVCGRNSLRITAGGDEKITAGGDEKLKKLVRQVQKKQRRHES